MQPCNLSPSCFLWHRHYSSPSRRPQRSLVSLPHLPPGSWPLLHNVVLEGSQSNPLPLTAMLSFPSLPYIRVIPNASRKSQKLHTFPSEPSATLFLSHFLHHFEITTRGYLRSPACLFWLLPRRTPFHIFSGNPTHFTYPFTFSFLVSPHFLPYHQRPSLLTV